ncbi:MAG: tetraacyldisaccharide 4'-kinase [Bdellovibrio sp.]|nr:tetraacyldisaccharide 4'-kinase [Bdellovibrio sp.]
MMLKPFEAFYQLASAAKNYLYEKEFFKSLHLNASVISIGNLSFGGTGKTPCIEFLANELSRGFKVAVVCRSYKARLTAPAKVDLSNPQKTEIYGDEACLLQKKLPQCQVWSGPVKFLTAQAADLEHPDLILIDDGFSHRQLQRDFDLVLFDTSYSNQDYFRESLESLKRAHAILLTKTHASSPELIEAAKLKILKYAPQLERSIFLSKTETLIEVSTEAPIFLFCGLAKPMSFRTSIHNLGYEVSKFRSFSDHFSYPLAAQKEILKEYTELKKQIPHLKLVTTEKDFVKLTDSDLLKVVIVAKHKMLLSDKDKVGLLEKIRTNL